MRSTTPCSELKRRVRALEKAAATTDLHIAETESPGAPRGDGDDSAGSNRMMPMSMPVTAELIREVTDFNTKVAGGIEKLSSITDDQVEIATTPKDLVFTTDKVSLYRYRPLVEQRVGTPVLIVYSLIGRHTMTDLQEDRSLVRNLLKQGVDLWVMDWGNASRADRWLTVDDYVSGYLDDCVSRDVRCRRRGQGQPAGDL